jgi:hypothetical protein
LRDIGQVDERHDGRFTVTVGGETEIFGRTAPPYLAMVRHSAVDALGRPSLR